MKKTLIVLSFIALASCGGGAGNKSASGNDTAVTAPASASTTISPDAEKAEPAIRSTRMMPLEGLLALPTQMSQPDIHLQQIPQSTVL